MECGDCTLCCELFPVRWLDKPAWTACKHCDKGCKIFNELPEECKGFNCLYRQSDKAHIELRPDKSGVVFEKLSDDVILGTLDPKNKVSGIAREQVDRFVGEGISVLLHHKNYPMPKIFPTEGTTMDEVWNKFSELKNKREEDDTTIVHN